MLRYVLVIMVLFCGSLTFLAQPLLAKDLDPPFVVKTDPPNGADDVDPDLTEIAVTFNETMMDKNWSWVYENKETFPAMTGAPYFTEDRKTCILPVKLQPGKKYIIWINSQKFHNFKDMARNPATPYRWTFTTE